MNRETRALETIGFLLVLAITALGQPPQMQPSPAPALPASILGPQLIVWSQMQQPRPVPQPLLPDSPERQPSQKQPGQAANSQMQQPPTQTFTGMIMRDDTKKESRYVLKGSGGATYQLDDQDNAKRYDGKQVKIVGNLDPDNNTLHVANITADFVEVARPKADGR